MWSKIKEVKIIRHAETNAIIEYLFVFHQHCLIPAHSDIKRFLDLEFLVYPQAYTLTQVDAKTWKATLIDVKS